MLIYVLFSKVSEKQKPAQCFWAGGSQIAVYRRNLGTSPEVGEGH